MAKVLRMQTRRVEISSADYTKVLASNVQRKYLRVAVSTGVGALPQSPGVVRLNFDVKGEEYLLVWVMQPYEPHMAPTNPILLRAMKDDPEGDDVSVIVEVTEGIEVEV